MMPDTSPGWPSAPPPGPVRSSGPPPPPNAAEWTAKGHHDFVTEVDRTAERLITDDLLRAEPGSRILGEEFSPTGVDLAGLVWVVDPLDGTTNFLHGYPWWSVSIAASIDGDLVAGTVLNVPAHRHYTAWRGGGAWCGADRLAVSTIRDPSLALLGTGFPFKALEHLPRYLEIVAHGHSADERGPARRQRGARPRRSRPGTLRRLLGNAAGPVGHRRGNRADSGSGGVVTDLRGAPAQGSPDRVGRGNPWMHEWMMGQTARRHR